MCSNIFFVNGRLRRAGEFLLTFALFASEAYGGDPIKKGPYLQWLLTTSVTVMWETSANVPSELAYSSNDSLWTTSSPARWANVCSATLASLVPDTRYSYRIRTDTTWSKTYSFKTAPLYADTVRFGWLADVRPPNYDTVYARMGMVVRRLKGFKPDFFFVGGDVVDRGDADGVVYQDQWTGYFKELTVLASSVGYWPVIGNHEMDYDTSLTHYFRYHHMPPRREYYSFDYASVHFVVLSTSTCEPGSPQYYWLVNDLQTAYYDPEIRTIFVAMHYPSYSSGPYGGQLYIKEFVLPLFENYGVSAVFSGHDHIYERSVKIRERQPSETGITYFVSGGGGSWMHEYTGSNWWTAARGPDGQFLHCLVVECVGDTCVVKCIAVDTTYQVPYDSVQFPSRRLYNTDSMTAPSGESLYRLPSIRAYPNPSRGTLNLLYDLADQDEGSIDVYNILGQSVQHLVADRSKGRIGLQQFDFAPLPSGMYFCILRTNRGSMTVPIVHYR